MSDPLVNSLARSLLTAEPTPEAIASHAAHTFGREWRFLLPLARRFLAAFQPDGRPTHLAVVHFLDHDSAFRRARARHRNKLRITQWLDDAPYMRPVTAASDWNLPSIATAGSLAEWLALSMDELDWFANRQQFSQHYHYRVLSKDAGRCRIIEAPKPRLKALQAQVLNEILEKVPPHPAAHGFLKGRSIKTFVSPHVAQRTLLRMDLENFFPSISGARISACFRIMGYPDSVASYLAALCTNIVPGSAGFYSRPHLPQGSPSSPALANLCFYRSDCRLHGLAVAAGANYTRYADDLAFSGHLDFEFFSLRAAAILLEEGFEVHHRKTRIMRRGVRQHLAGLVTNQHLNVMRPDFDRLKATLTNCLRHGPTSQNRTHHADFRAHLQGRVAFVESIHPVRGARLRLLFERIEWP